MAIELKEIQDALEGKLEVVKKEWASEREKDAKGFDSKVVKAMEDLKGEFSKQLDTVKETHQKELDKALIDVEEKFKSKESKPVSWGQAFQKSMKESVQDIATAAKSGKAGIVELKDFNYSDFSGYEPFVTDYRQVIPLKYESFHYRNILPQGSMSGEFVKYPRHNSTTGAAAEWAYNGDSTTSKPEIAPQIGTYQADAVWVAALLKAIPIAMLEDLTWLSSYLNNVGQRELLKAEDLLLQNGGTDITGILDVAQIYDGDKTVLIEKIIDAAFRQVKNALHTANGVVLPNADYTSILINKASGSGEYDLPGVVGVRPDGVLTILGMPVFSNSYLSTGQGIVGDWTTSQFIVRSAPRFRMFEQNGTDAEKNQVMMRIEERVALAHFYTNSYVRFAAHS